MEYKIPRSMSAREALSIIYPDSSRRSLQNWLTAARFFIDGKPLRREDTPLEEGQVLTTQDRFRNVPKIPGLKILYEDRHLIVIEKFSGLLSVPLDLGEGDSKRHALGLLRTAFNTDAILPVHRIDRDVSGVLLFSRGKESEERLKALFENHDLLRQYFAIVEGRVKEDQGTWKSRLTELPSYDVVESDDGKDAITHFEVLHRSPKYSYLRVTLETGRKHQIRVHCQMAGHSILGDKRYGAQENPIRRVCLHAIRLELIHPFTNRPLVFSSPIPPSFKSLTGTANAALSRGSSPKAL